jgi:energy-coupling factor transporter ATP-binding protein EcfA2
MTTTDIKIDTTSILRDFNNHLNIKDNKRIIFSGPFGTGKSTFLNEFTTELQDEYYAVKIYPIHYSVASNEDVFELIKYDILFHLLSTPNELLELKKEDFSKFLNAQMFVLNKMKFKSLLYSILELSGKVGTPVVNFIKELNKVYDDFKEYSEETKIDEKQLIEDYLKSFIENKGNINENDSNSKLIFELLGRIKSQEEDKSLKKVLIIDDLDRLDPEHIFRLFNVFSAHHDEVTNTNKFGFDKVIFVCDIENIRKIFYHKYGSDVDFSGYIDKFYSLTPYHFDNRRYVKSSINDFLDRIEFSDKLLKYSFNNNLRGIFQDSVNSIIFSLLDLRLINLRMLINVPKFELVQVAFKLSKHTTDFNTNLPIIVIFNILKNYLGSFEIVRNSLQDLNDNFDHKNFKSDTHYLYDNSQDTLKIISFCLPFLLPPDKAFWDISGTEANCYLDKYNVTVYYKGYNPHINGQVIYLQATNGKNENGVGDLVILSPYQVLLDTFDECRKRGFLS